MSKVRDSLSKITKERFFVFLLASCAICQFLIIQYFNFFEADIHIGVDASWEYLKSIVMGTYGGFYPTELLNSTTAPSNDKVFLLVAPLYRLTHNVWFSFAMTNCIILVGTILVFGAMMKDIGFSNIEKLLVINLFLCPYMLNGYTLQNDLGYFSCVYGVVAYYNMMVLEFIMILRVLALKEFKSKKTYIWIAVSLVAMCFTGASDGPVLIVMALVPAIAYVVIKALIENDKHVFVAWKSVYLYASFCAVAFGRVLGAVFNLPYQEDVRLWTTANQLWSNIGNLLCGYMMLLGAIPGSGREYSPLEMRGFCFVFGLIIFLVILISFMYWLIKLICAMVKHKKFNEHILFLLAVVLVDFVEFSLVYTSYGEDIFETRYLIISTMAAFVLVGYFVKDLADSLLFKKFGVVVLFVAIIGCDLMSDYLYKINTNESWQVDEILDDIKTTDAGLVYTWGKELTPIERCLRVYDNQRVYKAITKDFVLEDFGDYSVYDDSTQYQGPTILVVSKNEPAAPDEILKKYELISSNDQVDVYYCKSNPIDIQYWVSYGKKLKEGNN